MGAILILVGAIALSHVGAILILVGAIALSHVGATLIRDEAVVRSKAVYLALAILPDGSRDILDMWIEQTEGAKFWMTVFTDLKTRGCQDILIVVTDGLKGMSEALVAVSPRRRCKPVSST